MERKNIFKKFSLLPQGLRYKLLIAFSLMSIIPLLVIGYMANSFILLGTAASFMQVSIIALFCIIIAWLGLFLAKGIIERVVDMSVESKIITEGNYNRRIVVDAGDEIGQIGEAINRLTGKIKSNIDDLMGYQDKMKEMNGEIQKRVSVLSSLLQIGELIASSASVDGILEVIMHKLAKLYENGFAVLYLSEDDEDELFLKMSSSRDGKNPFGSKIRANEGIFAKVLQSRKHIVIDASSGYSSQKNELKTKHGCENIIVFPIFAIRHSRALLLVGSGTKNFVFTNDDLDMIKVFAEQILIALDNDFLMKKAESLEIRDNITKLFNKQYIDTRLAEEIDRSRVSQRPCSFIMIDIDGFSEYQDREGKTHAEQALKKVASVMGQISLPLGKPGRFNKDTFALIMPEVNKKGAITIAEKIRKTIEKTEFSVEKKDRLTVSCGVSENPLDGEDALVISKKAMDALTKAKQKGKNKVVAAGV